MESLTKEKLQELVDFLQDNTDLAERLNDISDKATINNPQGEFAQIERWLLEQIN